MLEFRSAAFSVNTKKTYASHLKSYLNFCDSIDVKPVPASSDTIAQYAAFLARTHRPSSVRQYLNIIRILHIDAGLPNPLSDSWIIKSTLKGIDRCLGTSVKRKKPIDPSLLIRIFGHLDPQSVLDTMFYAAALTMFFGTLRRSNLMPLSLNEFSPDKQFVREDFHDSGQHITVKVRWSKTIQFRERSYHILLPCLQRDHPLCPCKAIRNAFDLVKLPKDCPAFVSDSKGSPLTASVFARHFRKLLSQCGIHDPSYSSHSFRRGSACWALQCGIPGEIVQQLGDWKSSAYKDYLDDLPHSNKEEYTRLFAERLPSS